MTEYLVFLKQKPILQNYKNNTIRVEPLFTKDKNYMSPL